VLAGPLVWLHEAVSCGAVSEFRFFQSIINALQQRDLFILLLILEVTGSILDLGVRYVHRGVAGCSQIPVVM
jgi:hypothetical protein